MEQIFRIPNKYWELLNTMSDEDCWKLMKALFEWNNNKLDWLVLTYYNIIIVDINNIQNQVNKWRQGGLLWWRPKKKRGVIEKEKGGLWNKKPNIKESNINKDNINKDIYNNINNTKDIKSLVIHNFNYKISKYFLDYHIKEQTPSIIYLLKSKWEENILISWSKVIEKLQTIDKFSEKQIEYIIKKTLEDDFWKYQILSIEKFRKKKDGVSYFVKMIDIAKHNLDNALVINKNVWTL